MDVLLAISRLADAEVITGHRYGRDANQARIGAGLIHHHDAWANPETENAWTNPYASAFGKYMRFDPEAGHHVSKLVMELAQVSIVQRHVADLHICSKHPARGARNVGEMRSAVRCRNEDDAENSSDQCLKASDALETALDDHGLDHQATHAVADEYQLALM